MNVIQRKTLKEFWEKYPHAERPLAEWFKIATKATWNGPSDVKAMFGSADFIADNRVVFNIGGNKYRLVVHIAYLHKRVLIKFVGTHEEYDKISAETVSC